MKTTPDEIAADGSHEASYGWWVENSPTNHSHHVVHGTRSSIAALRVLLAALEQAEAKLAESERNVAFWSSKADAEVASHARTIEASKTERDALQANIEVVRRDLAKAVADHSAALDEAHALRAEVERLRLVVGRHQSVPNGAGDEVCVVCGQYWPCGEKRFLDDALAIRQQEEPKPAKPQAQVIDLMQALKDSLKAKPEPMEEGK